MTEIWFTSDTHLGHANILKFKDAAGAHLRSFRDVEEMDDTIIQRWNQAVKPGDCVYHLGDVLFGKSPSVLARLNGSKRLVLGNHDDVRQLHTHFKWIRMWRFFSEHRFIISHVPLREDTFRYKTVLNVHGHIHEKPDPSPNHLNVSVERTDYRPVHLDEILKVIRDRGL